MKGGKRKSFSGGGLKKSPSVSKNPTGSVMKHAAGTTGRAVNPRETPYSKKGNP